VVLNNDPLEKFRNKKKWEETKKYLQAFVQNLHLLSSITGSREEVKGGRGERLSKKKTQHKKPTTSPPKKKKATSFGLAACIRSSLLS